ncbi:MAG TPA: class I SAM-dependent methyltransferase [Trebonia sp.]|jgi:S-adenosylmethionine-dependent methyltransferase
MSGKDFGPAQAPVRIAYGDDAERRRGAPSTQVSDALDEVLAVRAARVGRTALEVVDVGAGTGGFAVRLAKLGHHVTVVDPSPDALAAARWRADELGVTLTAVQGEASEIAGLVGDGAADLVVCHNVLEYVDSPAAAMAAIARVLRPGGTVSVLAANVVAAVLQRALAGRYEEARRLLTSNAADPAPGPGSAPARVPAQGLTEHRRFTLAELTALIEGAGLRAGDPHGVRIFAGLLPGVGADPATADALRALEAAAADYPALRDIAARLHIFGHR